MSKNAKPIFKVEIWPCKAAIWHNKGTDGRSDWYNVTVERTYKEDEEYKSSGSFGRDDLLVLAKILDEAHTWIVGREKQDRQATPQGRPAAKTSGEDDVPF